MRSLCRMTIPLLFCVPGWGQPSPPAIKASGNGLVQAQPDQAKIDIAVVTQSAKAQDAASQNAAQLQSVMGQLKSVLGAKGEVRTSSYSLNPVYQYPKTGGKPSIEAYTATNTVEVTCNDLSVVGRLIDAATAGGANEIQRLQFQLKDDGPARARALRQAATEARANAEAMAGALGLKLGKVLLLEQSTPSVIRPIYQPMMAQARVASAPTPIDASPVEVQATVNLTIAVE